MPSIRRSIVVWLGCLALLFGAQFAIAGNASAGDSTPAGNWWSVDSVDRLNDANLAAIRAWYQGGTPLAWGRYISDISSSFTLNSAEITYAQQHGIYLYLIAADHTSSCGTDSTYAEGVADGQVAIAAAKALKIPAGAVIFKDFEERTSRCPGDPGAGFLEGWYAVMKNSNMYKAGFYGNSASPSNAFSKAYCQAGAAIAGFLGNTSIAASEPEPAFNNRRGSTGPRNAPAYAPTKPSCAPASATTIWQYGEVGSQAGNIADVDEVAANAPGLLAPNGTITGSTAVRVGSLARNLLTNGGFNNYLSGWHVAGGAHAAAYASGVAGTQAFESTGYLATNASLPSGSVYQDVAVKINAGDTYCVTAQATTARTAPGGSATFALWMLGGGGAENSTVHLSGLPGSSTWTPGEVCTTATTSHTTVRVQLYPLSKGPTVGLDAVTLVHDMVKNGGFNQPLTTWHAMTRTNMVEYKSSKTASTAYEGSGYMATNSSSSTGGVYQDVPMSIARGTTFCASGRFTTVGAGSGAGGHFVLWLFGGGGNEQSSVVLSGLPGKSVWTFAQACITATTSHTALRIQYYAAVNGPTVGMDAVDVD
jgi:Domain of unknown function (DUF1906)